LGVFADLRRKEDTLSFFFWVEARISALRLPTNASAARFPARYELDLVTLPLSAIKMLRGADSLLPSIERIALSEAFIEFRLGDEGIRG
jgi:hypothetical protein